MLSKFINDDLDRDEIFDLYTDGSLRLHEDKLGIGACLKNQRGEVVWIYQEEFYISKLPEEIHKSQHEELALFFALSELKLNGLLKVRVMTDFKGMVENIYEYISSNDKKQFFQEEYRYIYQRIYKMTNRFRFFDIYHIPRCNNKIADALSKGVIIKDLLQLKVKKEKSI